MTKKKVIEVLIHHIKRLGMKDISADFNGYPKPHNIKLKNSGKGYSPDVIASSEKKLFLFDVAIKQDPLAQAVNRWHLFSTYSHYNHGDFYIVSEVDREYTVKNFLNDQNIKAKVLPIKAK